MFVPVLSPRAAKGFLLLPYGRCLKAEFWRSLLENLGLQCWERWGDVEPAPCGERNDGWLCLSSRVREVTQSQLCLLDMPRGW